MVNIAPHNMTIAVGSDLRLVCEATGDLMDVAIRWLKDGFPLLEDGDDRITVTPQGELLVEDMMKSDDGKYTCSASRYESETSKSTTIYTEGMFKYTCSASRYESETSKSTTIYTEGMFKYMCSASRYESETSKSTTIYTEGMFKYTCSATHYESETSKSTTIYTEGMFKYMCSASRYESETSKSTTIYTEGTFKYVNKPPPCGRTSMVWDSLLVMKSVCAGGRGFAPRLGQYSKESFSSYQETGKVFSPEMPFYSKFGTT